MPLPGAAGRRALPRGPAGWGHPALRLPGWLRLSRLAGRSPWAVGAGFIPPGDVGAAAGSPGTMQASSPTGVATPPILRFPGWWLWFPRSVGRAFTPAVPWWFQNWNIRAAARSGGMRASRPTFARAAAAAPLGRAFAVGRRGGIYPARGRWRRRRVARDDASIVPYRGCDHTKLRPARRAAALPQICLPCQREVARPQAVTEGLPRLEMPLPGAAGYLRRRGVRRDEGIPPYVCPGSRGRPGWPGVRRGP